MVELISVIVPTYNEEGNLPAAIRSARTDDGVEVIVADAGSTDHTLPIALELADAVVTAPHNRAAQLNAGAAAASGSILVFLHADSCLAPGAIAAIRTTLAEPGVKGGAFTVRIGVGVGLGIITWGTNLRSRWLKLPYGDQAIFVGTETFLDLDGYRLLEIVEDVDFVQRLRRVGAFKLIDLPVATSDRRWRQYGMLRTTFANASALTLFQLGVAPQRIRRYYDSLVPDRQTLGTG